ncbi:MAG: DUF6273 domain-containing protein [Oscillospiraceae bacterium]|nr:DUF6273 domain-containing protein [Oscillospiraceae bacterium]
MSLFKKLLGGSSQPKSSNTAAQNPQPEVLKIPDYPNAVKDSFGRALVPFGSYPQTADGQKEPIMWIVLNPGTYKSDGGVLLLSEKILDCMRYYHDISKARKWPRGDSPRWAEAKEYLDTVDHPEKRQPNAPEYDLMPERRWPPDSNEFWMRSDLGKWLNGSSWEYDKLSTYPKKFRTDFFYDNAFTSAEQSNIINKGSGNVFVLSLDEIREYRAVLGAVGGFMNYPELRRAIGTDYVKNGEVFRDECVLQWDRTNMLSRQQPEVEAAMHLPTGNISNPCSRWWLRTVGEYNDRVINVLAHGGLNLKGDSPLDSRTFGVRPAIWVKSI